MVGNATNPMVVSFGSLASILSPSSSHSLWPRTWKMQQADHSADQLLEMFTAATSLRGLWFTFLRWRTQHKNKNIVRNEYKTRVESIEVPFRWTSFRNAGVCDVCLVGDLMADCITCGRSCCRQCLEGDWIEEKGRGLFECRECVGCPFSDTQ